MKSYGLNELRKKYLEFFESKGHLALPSFSLVPENDKSLLLINAGMAPLKPYFTGQEIPPRTRVTTCQKCIRTGEIETAYEKNTGVLIADEFERLAVDYIATPAVLCKNHGPFTWGKDAKEAVHNAVVLEEVAKMAARCEQIDPKVNPAPQELQDKHYYRKHGKNAYYGQSK